MADRRCNSGNNFEISKSKSLQKKNTSFCLVYASFIFLIIFGVNNSESQNAPFTYDTAVLQSYIQKLFKIQDFIDNNGTALDYLRKEQHMSIKEDLGMLSSQISNQSKIFEEKNRKTDQKLEANVGTLRSLVEAVNENRRQRELFEKNKQLADLDYMLFGSPTVIQTGCGGIIPLKAEASASVGLIFQASNMNSNRSHNGSVRCLWTIQNAENGSRQRLNISVISAPVGLPGAGFELYALQFIRGVNLTSTKLESRQFYNFNAQALFISFTSGNSTFGAGFVLKISVNQVVNDGYGYNFHYNSLPGSSGVSSYRDNELQTIAINLNQNTTFSVTNIDTESNHDRLIIYEVRENGRFVEHGRLSGTNSGTLLRISTCNPILAVFTSDGSQIRSGYQISWI